MREMRAAEHLTFRELGARFGVCHGTVADVLYGNFYCDAGGPLITRRRAWTPLSYRLDQVRDLLELHPDMHAGDLADRLKISKSHAYKLLNDRRKLDARAADQSMV